MKVSQKLGKLLSFVLCSILLINSFQVFSQSEVWDNPIPITDSISDNKNPILMYLQYDVHMFWEKTMDDHPSSIWMRNISDMDDPIEIFSDDIYHYRNPQYISFYHYPNPPDTLFYLFFESDMENSGVFNIYYSKYSQDGSFSNPEPIDFSYTGCNHMRITDRNLVWERGGNIECTRLNGWDDDYSFDETITIDIGNCLRPEVGFSTILYEKQIDELSRIYKSEYLNELWTAPEPFYTEGNNTSISVIHEENFDMGDITYLWESYQDGEWQIWGYDRWDDELEATEFTSSTKLEPHGLFFDIPIGKTDTYLWLSYMTFVNSEEGNGDIYANESFWSYENPINVSNSEAVDAHPQLIHLYFNYIYKTYLIWESTRNNHQQLFMCSTEFWVGNEKLESDESDLNISPNPFTHKTQINFNTKKNALVKMEIFDLQGRSIETLLQKNLETGKHDMEWIAPESLENGVYFVVLTTGSLSKRKKVILQR